MKNNCIFPIFIILLLCGFNLQSRTNNKLTSGIYHATSAVINKALPVPHDTCLDKKFSVVFYLIQDSLYTLPNNPLGDPLNVISTYSLNLVIAKLNQTFARICVSFENCKTVIIPNWPYNKWLSGNVDSIVTANWYTNNTINVYIPTKITTGNIDLYGYATPFPAAGSTNKSYVVLQKNMMLSNNNAAFQGDVLIHAFGHLFGLPHTFAEVSTGLADGPSAELSSGANSATAGDKFTDTEADPYPSQFDNSSLLPPICLYKYNPGTLDAGGQYYAPPTDNFMSAYGCRCRFTQEQYNYMAKMILTRRLYLH